MKALAFAVLTLIAILGLGLAGAAVLDAGTTAAVLDTGTAVAGANAQAEAPAPEEAKEEDKPGESPEDLAQKRRALERKMKIAELKLEQARMALESARESAALAEKHARVELELAMGKMTQYAEVDSKNKIEQAELSLRGARDRAHEAAEELAQIELMYEGQDLDDRTAEFVIARGKRNAERAARQIAIQERSLASLAEHEVPREIRRLQLDVDRKKAALEKEARSARVADLKNRIGVLSAESEIAGHQEEMAKLERKASEE